MTEPCDGICNSTLPYSYVRTLHRRGKPDPHPYLPQYSSTGITQPLEDAIATMYSASTKKPGWKTVHRFDITARVQLPSFCSTRLSCIAPLPSTATGSLRTDNQASY